MKQKILLSLIFINIALITFSQVLPVKEQAKLIDEVLSDRVNHLLPDLMEKKGIDMWVIISREYNEDPILRTMLPATWLSARRRTILVFYHPPKTKIFKKMAIARYNVGNDIEASWDMTKHPDQWDALNNIVENNQPQKIGVNISNDFGHADGISHTEYNLFINKLSEKNKAKVVSASNLGVAWLETRTARELAFYPTLNQITHQIIAEGFSNKVITPGITTTDDLVWWFRQKVTDLGLTTWFHPSVQIQRNDKVTFDHLSAFTNVNKENTIMPGDLLHVDFGISYLRLNTDVQEHAYVLAPGEMEVPSYLMEGFSKANRLQDILTNQFKEKRTGNEILSAALEQSKNEKITASIYTHPLGYHGHAAGPTIGMWDQQNSVPGSGDYPMYYNTAYSIELNASVEIKEWNKQVRFMLEQNGYYNENGFKYLDGRQKKIHVIGTRESKNE